jgi:hypothetical protein
MVAVSINGLGASFLVNKSHCTEGFRPECAKKNKEENPPYIFPRKVFINGQESAFVYIYIYIYIYIYMHVRSS